MSRLRRLPLSPFLVAAYAVLTLLVANLGQVRPSVAYRPLIVALIGAGALLLLIWLVSHDLRLAGLLSAWWLLLFFSYGHAYNALKTVQIAGEPLGRHRYLLPVCILLALVGLWLLVKNAYRLGRLRRGGQLFLATAVVLAIAQVLWFQYGPSNAPSSGALDWSQVSAASDQLPDIYYIILDAYARQDTLLKAYDFDNSAFLEALTNLGFYVATCSQSNYSQTELSLSSSLNSTYLQDLFGDTLHGNQDRERLWPLIRQSAVRKGLEGLGYSTVGLETGYYWTELEDADVYLAPSHGLLGGMTAFEGTLVRSTAAWALIDVLPKLPPGIGRDLDRSVDAHRELVRFVLDQLESIPELPGPKFVFVHLVSPHRPFVFDALGNPVSDDYQWTRGTVELDQYQEGYRQQIQFLNGQLLPIVAKIIARSRPAPVILIQSDHGPEAGSSQERMRNLSAFFLGVSDPEDLRPDLSPVNSFRLVMRARFGSGVSLLPDVSYYSNYEQPFQFNIVDQGCGD